MTTLTQPPPRPHRDRPHGGSVLSAGHRGTWCAGTGPQPSGPGDGRPPGHPPQPPPPTPGNPDAPKRAGQDPPYPPGGPGPGPGPTGPGPGPSGPSGPGRGWQRMTWRDLGRALAAAAGLLAVAYVALAVAG